MALRIAKDQEERLVNILEARRKRAAENGLGRVESMSDVLREALGLGFDFLMDRDLSEDRSSEPKAESKAKAPGDTTPARDASPKKAGGHGARLPEPFDFAAYPEAYEYAIGLGFTPADAARLLEDFTDYWRACAGQRGRKLDWPATWRTWVRRERDKRQNSLRTGKRPVDQQAQYERLMKAGPK